MKLGSASKTVDLPSGTYKEFDVEERRSYEARSFSWDFQMFVATPGYRVLENIKKSSLSLEKNMAKHVDSPINMFGFPPWFHQQTWHDVWSEPGVNKETDGDFIKQND